ncbi:hypothetical protein QE364_000815 [Nocardioides zeae]|uniref:Uncharacterized protein n=1 Tax=Nocardioides zeae TaxID=1457234 RepID=A0ACC6IEQ7_9ACTN|nr:hypothetical protein [Nocardioides zeae]MDR6174318.1 hypothetical protein [Nocardioides zeae]MDR6209123.1 hypothetical protein [Nocardioides zeae]
MDGNGEREQRLEGLAMQLEAGFDEHWLRTGPPRRIYERTVGHATYLGGDIERSAPLCALAVDVPAADGSDLVVMVLLQDDEARWTLSAFDIDHVPDGFLGGAARRALVTAPYSRPIHHVLVGGRIRIDLLQVRADIASCTLDGRPVAVTERGTVLVVGAHGGVLRFGREDDTEVWRGTLDEADRLGGGPVWDERDRADGDLGDIVSIVSDHR